MNFKLIPFVATAGLIAGCGLTDENVTNASAEAKEKAKITVKVVDYKTGLPVDSAKVYSVLKGDTMYTDESGIVTWKGNVLGDYDYVVIKDGYAGAFANVTVEEKGMGNTARVPDYIVPVQLREEGVVLNGTVLAKNVDSDELSAASDIEVVVRYVDGDVYPAEVKTTTDAKGLFTFDNLAEYAKYEIIVPQTEIDELVYAAKSLPDDVDGLRAGEIYNVQPIKLEVVSLSPELIASNLKNLEEKDDINLTFSTKLLSDSVASAWYVYKNGSAIGNECDGGNAVLVTSSLNKEGTKVIINSVSNEWDDTYYCVEGVAYTENGGSKKIARNFTPGAVLERPSMVKITSIFDDELDGVTIQWKESKEDISGYAIYYKTNKMADYVEFRTVDADADEYSFEPSYLSQFDDVKYAYFVVLPYIIVNDEMYGRRKVLAEIDEKSIEDYERKFNLE